MKVGAVRRSGLIEASIEEGGMRRNGGKNGALNREHRR